MDPSQQNPEPIQLPPTEGQHPSESGNVSYSDPNAPKPTRKLHKGKIIILVILALILGAGAAVWYFRFRAPEESSVISDYSGGLAESEPPASVVTEETKTAKQFLQAVQAQNAAAVDALASEALKQQVRSEAKNDVATVLSYYEGRFDGIDFDTLISSIKDGADETGASGKLVSFSDVSSTYTVEALVVEEGEALKINSIKSVLAY